MEQSWPEPTGGQAQEPGSWPGKETLDLWREWGEAGVGGPEASPLMAKPLSALLSLPKRGDTGAFDSKAPRWGGWGNAGGLNQSAAQRAGPTHFSGGPEAWRNGVNFPQPRNCSRWWGQDGSCGFWPLVGGPFFFTAAASSSQDVAGQGSALRSGGVALSFPRPRGTLISRLQTWVWMEQGLE